MIAWVKHLFYPKPDKDQQRVESALGRSTVTSRRVTGRGCLTMDARELWGTDKFQEYLEKGADTVRRCSENDEGR